MSLLKKIFFFCLFLFVLSLLLWGVYNFSFNSDGQTSSPAGPAASSDGKNKPAAASSTLTTVTSEAILAPILAPNGQSIKYFSKSGNGLYEINPDGGNKNTLDSQNFPGLVNAFWSPEQTAAILQFSKNNQTSFAYKDFSTHQETPLKNNLDRVAWQTNADRIFYKYYDPKSGSRTLNVADPDGSHWTKLADLPYRNLSIAQVPKSSLVSFWNTGDAFSQTLFQSVSVLGGTPKTILANVYGADYLWDDAGDSVLVSHTDSQGGHKMQLAAMNYNGGEYHDLDINTLVSKCAWSSDGKTVYYALPGNIPASAILPNDYNNGQFNTTDTFWKVDVRTGQTSQLIDPKNIRQNFDATDLFLNQDESALFFLNRADGKLYKLTL
jgi:hypothetical protein